MNVQRLWAVGIIVLVLAAIINVGALNVAERGFVDLREPAARVRHTQRAQNLIEHLLRLAVDAETGQRGYLMTGRDTQLEHYVESRNEIPVALKELRELTEDNPVQAAQLITVSSLLDARMEILEAGIALKRSQDEAGLVRYMHERGGKIAMDSLRLALDGMAAEEAALHERRFHAFERNLVVTRWGFYLVVGLNLLLITMGAIFLGQDSRRRRREAAEVKERNAELSRAVLERTAELTELSHFLQRLQEDERARLAREIHDELGGTLAAVKIDLQMVSNKLAPDDEQQTRLARAMAAIDDAVQVKRRIIEDLRPSVLDNIGFAAAIRWQCSEYTKRTGIPCRVEFEDDHVVLPPAHSIAFYRVVQEALTNISKHAKAKNVAVSLSHDHESRRWNLRIADDGIGIDLAKPQNPTGHGLLAMRERARALGGEFSIHRHPGNGTVVEVSAPFAEA
jgi:signal transduction histidine kinase